MDVKTYRICAGVFLVVPAILDNTGSAKSGLSVAPPRQEYAVQ